MSFETRCGDTNSCISGCDPITSYFLIPCFFIFPLTMAMEAASLHIAMYPWLAMGHLTPYLHLANKLAKRGHKISFFIPKRTQSKLQHFNHFPHLITFVPITLPHVEGLPHTAETTSDVPSSLSPLIMTTMDRTEKEIELLLNVLKPNIVFFDFTHWLPNLTKRLGIKSVHYYILTPMTIGYLVSPARMLQKSTLTEADLLLPPPGFPDSSIIKLRVHETPFLAALRKLEFGNGVLLHDRMYAGSCSADAIGFKGCREIEGPFLDYLEAQFQKQILLSGPVIPEPNTSVLEEKWAEWLGGFQSGSVIYCALGSEVNLQENQFQELLLGLELSNFPFLAALRPPLGYDSIVEALPEGFEERIKGRGIVHGGWVQQQLILGHSSVGCFVTHCGANSITEALVNECQMVFLPYKLADCIFNARMMSQKYKVGVEVEKSEEDGLFTKESVCRAVKIVMEDESVVGREVRENHAKLRSFLLSSNLESSCLDSFCRMLQDLGR